MTPNQVAVYHTLPIFCQNILCSAEGWRLRRSRYNKFFWQTYDEYISREQWNQSQLSDYSRKRLEHFLTTCPAALFPLAMSSHHERIEHFSKLPISQKSTVKDQMNDGTRTVRKTRLNRNWIPSHTSGTTGAGMRFWISSEALYEQLAVWGRYRSWHGIAPLETCGYFGGRPIVPLKQTAPPFWRLNVPMQQILFSGYHMSEDRLEAYVQALNQKQPRWLHGYPSLIALLADYILSSGIKLEYELKWITTGAENLLPYQKKKIVRAFGITPRQHYGLAEGVANFSECELGRLHVDEDFSFVEFIPIQGTAVHRIIGTNFTNKLFPLIRYDTGDIARLSRRACPCGRPGRVVEGVDGRDEDYLILANGSRIGRLDHIFKDLVSIRLAQFRQKEEGRAMLLVVKGKGYSESDETLLLQEVDRYLGNELKVTLEYVNSIAATKSGKHRLVVSEIATRST